MHALRLITRYKYEGTEEEAALLVYDSAALTGTMLSDDVRDHFNQRPITRRVYILAPFLEQQHLKRLMFEGSLFDRVRVIFRSFAGEVSMLTFVDEGEAKRAVVIPFRIDESGNVVEEPSSALADELRHGWLFSLFDSNRGLVNAPPGVHFGKGSKKHSAKFLRVSAVLLTSEACAVIAYFTLASTKIFQPRRMFVDTAPLISVAFALQRIAIVHGLWEMQVPVSSFSSYGGMDKLPRPSRRDLVLISASTSGGLVKLLTDVGFSPDAISLLFFLGQNDEAQPKLQIIGDLTYRSSVLYGYASIENYASSSCPLCAKGYFLAALEGDQFMLEARAVKELLVRTKSQSREARDTVEVLARNRLASIPIYANSAQRFEIDLDLNSALQSDVFKGRVVQMLRRFMPAPLDYIVLVDVDERVFDEILLQAQLGDFVKTATVVQYSALRSAPKKIGAGVLVFVACLKEYAKVRDVNAELRTVAEGGCIAYLSALTLAESPEQLSSLRNFLTYGANGRDSFTFVSAYTLMLPYTHDERSSWDSELELLREIIDDGEVSTSIEERIKVLQASSGLVENLFWSGRSGDLKINNDFVYLNTAERREEISQADLYLVVSNLLASVRVGDRSISGPAQNDPVRWQQSVYGNTLLSVANFEDYNDSVLRAAFVRAASNSELNYSAHPPSSARILEILRQGILGWQHDMGDFLPEFFLALATHRMVLTDADIFEVRRIVASADLPDYLKVLAKYI